MKILRQKTLANIIFTLEDTITGKYLGTRIQLLPKFDIFWTDNGSFGIDIGWLSLRFNIIVVDIDDIDNEESKILNKITK